MFMSADEFFLFTHLLWGESEGPVCTSCRRHQCIRDLVSAAHTWRVLEEIITALFCFTAGWPLTSPWTPYMWNKCVWEQPYWSMETYAKPFSCCLVCEQPVKPLKGVRSFWLTIWFHSNTYRQTNKHWLPHKLPPPLAEVISSRSTNSCNEVKFYCF